MAQPQLKAAFFVDPSGRVIPKAPILSTKQRWRIFDRDKDVCQKCGEHVVRFGKFSPYTPLPGAIDHILARARGGQNDDSNLRVLCITCNSQKGSKDV